LIRTSHLVYITRHLLHRIYHRGQLVQHRFANAVNAYPEPSGCRPLTLYHLQNDISVDTSLAKQASLRTIHDYFHIIHKSVDHFQGLRDGHSAFLLSETVEPLVAQPRSRSLQAASLRISLYHVELPRIEDDDPLTESALFNLLGSEGKHRE
jgi:hypothetical protein